MADRKPIIAGNWKMHHDHFTAIQYTQKLSYLLDKKDYDRVDVVLCPPFTDLRSVQTTLESDRIRSRSAHRAATGRRKARSPARSAR